MATRNTSSGGLKAAADVSETSALWFSDTSLVPSLSPMVFRDSTRMTTSFPQHNPAPQANMSSSNPPPWLTNRGQSTRQPPTQPSVPSKRSADARIAERPSKRSNVSTTAQEEAWVADEDRFVLQQAKKKAALRVKAGRAKPIDFLAVTLRFVDPTKTLLDEEVEDRELEVVDPEGLFETLGDEDLSDLEKDIEHYLTLETNRSNREYWNVCFYTTGDTPLLTLCRP